MRAIKRLLRVGVYATALFGFLGVCLTWFMRQHVAPRILATPDEATAEHWAIVFGAKVWGQEPSPMLQDRMEVARQLYAAGKVRQILVSGGPSVKGLHEADFMRNWLITHGVSPVDIALDHDGLDTEMTMQNAKEKFGIMRGYLVTQAFHLPRAIWYGRIQGQDVRGVIADQRDYKEAPFHAIRESAALVVMLTKAWPYFARFWDAWQSSFETSFEKAPAIEAGRQRLARVWKEPITKGRLVYNKTSQVLTMHVLNGAAWRQLTSWKAMSASGHTGPKLREGDLQVPEGIYNLTYLNELSKYHLAIRVGYPNAFDTQKGQLDGRTALGGDIMIHGQNLSIGCIAMGDDAMEEIFAAVKDSGLEHWTLIVIPDDEKEWPRLLRDKRQPTWYGDLLESMRPLLQSL